MSEERRWIFIYLCPGLHEEHIRWIVVEDEEEAETLARTHDLAWPAASAMRGFVRFYSVGVEVDPAGVVDRVITFLREIGFVEVMQGSD